MITSAVLPWVRLPGSTVVTSRSNGENFSATSAQIWVAMATSAGENVVGSPSRSKAGVVGTAYPAHWKAAAPVKFRYSVAGAPDRLCRPGNPLRGTPDRYRRPSIACQRIC